MANRRVWMGSAAIVAAVVLALLGLRSMTKGAEPREAAEFCCRSWGNVLFWTDAG